jgi:hypothetical protein
MSNGPPITKWTFLDKTGAPVIGITKMSIQDINAKTPNGVKFKVTGKDGTYPVVPADVPIKATAVLGAAASSTAGECGETLFTSGNCKFNGTMDKLTCKY